MNRTAMWIRKYNTALVIPMVAGTIVMAIARQREFLFENWDSPIAAFIISLVVFTLFYALAWLSGFRASVRNRIAFTLSSGLNNITLSIVLAMLYFSPDVALFLVVANISWVVVLIPFRRFLAANY
jgi:predicted Na+-dependent transporter